MIPLKGWTIKYYLVFGITAGLALSSIVSNGNHGMKRNSKDSAKPQADASSRNIIPSKRLVKTINDQLRQVITKLPRTGHRGLTSSHFEHSLSKKSPWLLERNLHTYGKKSEIVPNSGTIVEVFDDWRADDNDFLKRDKIGRPEVAQGNLGIGHDRMGIKLGSLGITRGNMSKKERLEQSLTEVVDDESNESSNSDGNIKIRKTNVPGSLKIQGIDEHDLESLRKLVKSEKDKGDNDNDKLTNPNSNHNDQYNANKNETVANLDAIAERYGITSTDDKSSTSIDVKTDSSRGNVSNFDKSIEVKDDNDSNINNNDTNTVLINTDNNKNNVSTDNNSDKSIEGAGQSTEIQELIDSIGNLKTKGGISDEQLNNLKDTVQNFLSLKTLTDENLTQNKAFDTSLAEWGQWAAWSACSVSCDNGKRTRTRTCGRELNEDGRTCPGSSVQAESCLIRHCPVDGGYTDWTSWSSCSETCGQQSLQLRMRICMDPRPEHGGKDCPGPRFRIRHCTVPLCQDDSAMEGSGDKEKLPDDSNEILNSLKTVLQLKTSSLEEKLSDEKTDSASKLFDSIYQGGNDTVTSGVSENTSKSNDVQRNQNSSENILQKANAESSEMSAAVTSDTAADLEMNGITDFSLKLDEEVSNKAIGTPSSGEELPRHEDLSSIEKEGGLNARLKNTNDTADLERLTDLVGNLDNAPGDETSPSSNKMSESGKTGLKGGDADILGTINANAPMLESPLRVNHAWESGLLEQKHEMQKASVHPSGNDSSVVKFDSIHVNNNETMLTEVYPKNSFINAANMSSLGANHVLNSTISNEDGNSSGSGHKPSKELDTRILNTSVSKLEEKTASSKNSAYDHVQVVSHKDADHVRLRTASISTTDNGTWSSSIMGVIRYDADTLSGKGNIENVRNNETIRIHDNGKWSSWASCSRSCGRGYQTRRKEICLEMSASGEYDCSHVKVQKKPCGDAHCPEIQNDLRVKVHRVKVKNVPGSTQQNDVSAIAGRIPQDLQYLGPDDTGGSKHEIMGVVRQELDADFLPWSSWSACSLTCGMDGTRTRTRRCQGKDKPNCIGPTHGSKACFLIHCPVKGQWSAWSQWTPCSQSCGKSLKLRMRKCDNPAPSHGGEKCLGEAEEQMECDVPACPVNGHWSVWSAWSSCPVTCGKALKHRTRVCNNPPPSKGGLSCDGKSTEHLACYLPSCPIDGGLSHWQSWSKCHKTCGNNSYRTRFRFCNNPPPSDGGKTCHGHRLQVSKCSNKPCTEPINGGFSQWSNWSSCSLNCETGSVKYRTRMCNNPTPLYGGMECVGDDTEYTNCSTDECKVDGGFSDWTAWSSCSKSCGDMVIKSRERSCTKPPPSGGGKNCSGETFEIKLCETKPCPQEITTPAPARENEQTDTPLVQTIIDEKEQLLTEKKSGNNALFSDLKKKLIENLKKLAPDLGLSLGNTSSTGTRPTPEKAKEATNTNQPTTNPPQVITEVRNDAPRRKLGRKENMGDLKEQLKDPDDRAQDEEDFNPIKSCGFNPCRLAKCLSDPFADCFPNTNCDPVYYDNSGNLKKDCSVETTFLTAPASRLCERDPCDVSMCLKLPMTKCVTNALCKPVYFDVNGNVLNCTGVLKTPVRLSCGKDPCVGKLCPVDAEARCFTDYGCKSTFWNLDSKEEVNECKVLELQEDEEENANYRSRTPTPLNGPPSKKTLRRPWLRLSKSTLNEILKESQGNHIFMAHAKLKHFRRKNRLSPGQPGLAMILNEHNNDVDLTSTIDDDTKHSDEHDGGDIPYTASANKKPEVSLSGVPTSKLKQYNNPRRNPILTLTSLNTDQYQSQGGNGVSVTKDWRLKLKPPIHLNGYVESPQVYKVNSLTHDRDQNTEEYLFHHQNNGLFSQDLSSQRLNAEGSNAVGLNSQSLISEGKISDSLSPGRLQLPSASPGRLSLERLSSDSGLSPERLASEGLHSDFNDLRRGSMTLTPESNSIDSIDRLLKTDEAHVRSDGIDTAHAVTTSPYAKILNQDISDVESALSHAEGQIPGEGELPGLGSPVVPQTLAASIRSPEVEKQNQLNLVELQARHDIVPNVGDPRTIPTEIPAGDLADSEGGRYVPLDSVIDDLRANVGTNNVLNENLGLP